MLLTLLSRSGTGVAAAALVVGLHQPAPSVSTAVSVSPSPLRVGVHLSAVQQFVTATPLRVGVHPSTATFIIPPLTVLVNGVDVSNLVRRGAIDIEDLLNQEPNSCQLKTRANAFTPVAGQSVLIYQGGIYYFAGQIVDVVQQSAANLDDNVAYTCTCTDWIRLFNRRMVIGRYNASASTVVASIVSSFTSGFTTAGVAASLPNVEIVFTGSESPGDALDKIALAIGGYWYIDVNRDVHFFLTESTSLPDVVTEANTVGGLPQIVRNVTQLRTQIQITGAGSSTTAPVAAGASIIPLQDATAFAASGQARATDQIVSYTGKNAGGAATNVASAAGPGSAPSAAIGSGAGKVLGVVSYKVALKNAAGETTPGPASGNVTGVAFTTPGACTPALASGLGRLVGTYTYKLTYVTSLGETDLGSVSTGVSPAGPSIGAPTVGTVVATGNSGGSAYSPGFPGRLAAGAYGYKITIVDADGESVAGTAGTRTCATWAPDGAAGTSSRDTTEISALEVGGVYHWRITLVFADGTESIISSNDADSWTTSATSHAPTAPTGSFVAGGNLTASSNYGWKVSYIDKYGHEPACPAPSRARAARRTKRSTSRSPRARRRASPGAASIARWRAGRPTTSSRKSRTTPRRRISTRSATTSLGWRRLAPSRWLAARRSASTTGRITRTSSRGSSIARSRAGRPTTTSRRSPAIRARRTSTRRSVTPISCRKRQAPAASIRRMASRPFRQARRARSRAASTGPSPGAATTSCSPKSRTTRRRRSRIRSPTARSPRRGRRSRTPSSARTSR
jgi:hypothetical protein